MLGMVLVALQISSHIISRKTSQYILEAAAFESADTSQNVRLKTFWKLFIKIQVKSKFICLNSYYRSFQIY